MSTWERLARGYRNFAQQSKAREAERQRRIENRDFICWWCGTPLPEFQAATCGAPVCEESQQLSNDPI